MTPLERLRGVCRPGRDGKPVACGIGRVPVTTYAIGTAISSVIWSLVFAAYLILHRRQIDEKTIQALDQ